MNRADYRYYILHDEKVIAIEDLNKGNTSLTNDIENVAEEISKNETLDLKEYKVIYRDSQGLWDGYNPFNNRFIILRIKGKMQAIDFSTKITIETWLK